MNLLQKFISTFLIQIFGFFIINPLFATSDSNFIITTSANVADSCSKNIQCYSIGENQYSCTQTESGINGLQGHTNNIQIGKTDILSEGFSAFHKIEIAGYIDNLKSLYKNPEGDRYPFVGIIKIQV